MEEGRSLDACSLQLGLAAGSQQQRILACKTAGLLDSACWHAASQPASPPQTSPLTCRLCSVSSTCSRASQAATSREVLALPPSES